MVSIESDEDPIAAQSAEVGSSSLVVPQQWCPNKGNDKGGKLVTMDCPVVASGWILLKIHLSGLNGFDLVC